MKEEGPVCGFPGSKARWPGSPCLCGVRQSTAKGSRHQRLSSRSQQMPPPTRVLSHFLCYSHTEQQLKKNEGWVCGAAVW